LDPYEWLIILRNSFSEAWITGTHPDPGTTVTVEVNRFKRFLDCEAEHEDGGRWTEPARQFVRGLVERIDAGEGDEILSEYGDFIQIKLIGKPETVPLFNGDDCQGIMDADIAEGAIAEAAE
jgi:hypothetical protein